VFATNRLVVAVPAGPPHPPTPSPAGGEGEPERLEDLASPEFQRIAIGNPETAPVGALAREALTAAGLWDALQPRLIFAENAPQIAAYLRRAEVDAAILWSTDLLALGEAAELVTEVDGRLHGPSEYLAGIVTGSAASEQARAFLNFLRGPEGREALRRAGFGVPD
jgi:molybdate transport system substrate-binding protein